MINYLEIVCVAIELYSENWLETKMKSIQMTVKLYTQIRLQLNRSLPPFQNAIFFVVFFQITAKTWICPHTYSITVIYI